MNLATVATYTTRGDAEIARAHLAAEGIAASVTADNEGGLNPGFYRDYGVRVVVDEQQLDASRAVLGIFTLDPQVHTAILQHARFCAPNEACGLLAMDASGSVQMVYCCTNADESPNRFTVDPAEHFGALRHAERNGWEIRGAFHSHPAGAARPSRTDIERWPDPTWIQLIVGGDGEVGAYRLVGGSPERVSVEGGG